MEFLTKALEALPSIAASPLAFVGYVLTIGAWVYAYNRSRRLKLLLQQIKDIPEQDRIKTIQLELGEVLPEKVSAEQWLRSKRQKYYFAAFVLLLVTVISLFTVAAYRGQAKLIIDDAQEVLPKSGDASSLLDKLSPFSLISSAHAESLQITEDSSDTKRFTYTFDLVLRNPSNEPVNVTDVRVIFDPGTGGGLANVQVISGTYVVTVNKDEATSDGPLGRFQAYAWYPSGSGRLHVKTPVSQSLKPNSVDRIRIIVEFPNDYHFRGSMEEAVLQVFWNGERYEESKRIKLAKR